MEAERFQKPHLEMSPGIGALDLSSRCEARVKTCASFTDVS